MDIGNKNPKKVISKNKIMNLIIPPEQFG